MFNKRKKVTPLYGVVYETKKTNKPILLYSSAGVSKNGLMKCLRLFMVNITEFSGNNSTYV